MKYEFQHLNNFLGGIYISVLEIAKKYEQELVAFRRDLHMHPETPGNEERTSRRICEELDKIGIPYKHMGNFSVVGEIKGAFPGKTFALRADFDALSIEEETSLPYKSTIPGAMHACGHDIHAAMLLGAAKVLLEKREELHGNVRLIFQEAEEHLKGGKLVCADGGMDGVDGIFALHCSADSPVGYLEINYGARSAACCGLHMEIEGKAGHSSKPDSGIDAMMCGCEIIQAMQTVVKHNTDPNDFVVVHVGRLVAGNADNVISETARLDGGIRYHQPEYEKIIPPLVERVVHGIASAHGCKVNYLRCNQIVKPVINHAALTDIVIDSAKKVMGENCIRNTIAMGGSEDFCWYGDYAPSSFAFIGTSPFENGSDVSLHNGHIIFDEAVIPLGAAVHAQVVLDFFSQDEIPLIAISDSERCPENL